jgi:hypothetical protein
MKQYTQRAHSIADSSVTEPTTSAGVSVSCIVMNVVSADERDAQEYGVSIIL